MITNLKVIKTVRVVVVASALAASALAAAPVQAQTPPTSAAAASSKIARVVVFADRAEVTRTATARCEGGTASVRFTALPDSIDPRTLRGEADGDVVVVGVSTETTELVEALDAQVQQLTDQIRELDDAIARVQREQADDNERITTIASYRNVFRTLVGEDLRKEKPDVSRWEQLLTFIQSESVATSTARVQRDATIRDLSRRRERLSNRLERLNPSDAPSNVTATVAVQCGSSTSPVVRLAYVVPAASWHPEYDLRFTPPSKTKTGDGTAVLTVAGVVTQSSGEDWTDAVISLSTAKPRLGGEAPLPNPITVYGQPEDKQKTLVQAQEHRADDLKAGATSPTAAAGASLQDGGKAFVLTLPNKVTVRADGRPYWFPVDDVSAKAKSSLVAVPNLSPYVFQVVALNNPAAYPLMEGTVHVFRGNTFVGDEQLVYRAPGEPIELSLGIDEEVALERIDLQQQQREAGFLSGNQSIVHGYRTILHNRSGQYVVVEVREQVPVSKSADIKVTVDNAKTTTGYGFDPVRGHLKWNVGLQKSAKQERDIAFTIALPKEWAVR